MPPKRHDVERQVEGIHHHESAEHRDGNRDAGDQGRARIAQEGVQHQDREQTADQRGALDLADRRVDEVRLVVDGLDHRPLGQRLPDLLHPRTNARGELYGIRVTFLVDGELDRFLAVDARDGFALLVTVAHRRDVPQIHGLAVARGDDRIGHLLDRSELVQRAHQEALHALLQPAAGQVDVLRAYPARNDIDREAELRQLLLVDEHLHLVLVAAAHLHGGGALDGLEIRFQPVLREPAQGFQTLDRILARRLVEEGQSHDRLARRVEAQQQRALCLERQLQQVELLADVDPGEIHVRAPDELEDHVRLSRPGDRANLADVADDPDRFFHRPRDQVLDLERRRARELGAYRERRVREIGQKVELESRQRHEPEERDRHRAHDDGHAAADRKIDQLHDVPPKRRRRSRQARPFSAT